MSVLRDSVNKWYLILLMIETGMIITAAAIGLGWLVIVAAVLSLMTTVCFLYHREKMYRKCCDIVELFEEGDYNTHLPKNREGSFYALLDRIDRLAMNLKSKNDKEEKGRVLIGNRISDISHQLKTPLAALLMYNEIMAQEPENPEVVREFVEKSNGALERMQQLIQTLLLMTRLDSGSITFTKDNYCIKELVTEAVRDLLVRAAREKKEIHFLGNEKDLIYCDKKWTMEAISNIVKNALDYTTEGKPVEIDWETGTGVARVKVRDYGIGINSEEICHIFTRFYRGSNNKNNGVGLGLPLTKAIIEEQGGTILIDSIQGEGTTMTLSLLQQENA